jgi:hypothetical protein
MLPSVLISICIFTSEICAFQSGKAVSGASFENQTWPVF